MHKHDQLVDSFILKSVIPGTIEDNHIPKFTYNRFDLGLKSTYAEFLGRNLEVPEYLKSMYWEHIRAFTSGSFKECGNDDKDTIEKYHSEFFSIFSDLKSSGFDSNRSLIPLASDGSILNGAHRYSCSKVLSNDVAIVKTNASPAMYDYQFFKNRGLKESTLDYMALKNVTYSDDCYLAIVWSVAKGKRKEIESLLGRVIYNKTIELTKLGAHNLLSTCYKNETWIGNRENNYRGIINKQKHCFSNDLSGSIDVYLFQEDSIEKVLGIKEDIRGLFNIGKHSVHITDNNIETTELAECLLNENSIDFLNNGKPNKYNISLICDFMSIINKNKLDINDYLLDSSTPLSLYGLRQAQDLDYLSLHDNIEATGIDYNIDNIKYHDENLLELLYNPKFYFYYKGLKVLALPQLIKFKKNRGSEKDYIDIELASSVRNRKTKKINYSKLRYIMFKLRVISRANLVKLLDFFRIKGLIKKWLKL